MNKVFEPDKIESQLYDFWLSQKLNKAQEKGKPFTIVMPPPNANASLHAGHGMYVIDDIMVRYKRLQGFSCAWIPGLDHAGFETQYVFEKHLKREGKSRLDYDRQTLYKKIRDFVGENSGLIYKQFSRLGFLADWDRSVFSLDSHVVEYVYDTFKKMVKDGLLYRDTYMVNYCTRCGTSLADLEVKYVERQDPLYYINYGPFVLATVRPETKFGDTAVAVNPKDKRYKDWVGKKIKADGLLGEFELKVIADEFVDPDFGTGVVKVTPAHDYNDFEIGKRHNLEVKQVIGRDGRLNNLTGKYKGLTVYSGRAAVVEDLQARGLMAKVDDKYTHSVATCYKCGRDIEPMIIPNWFLRVGELKKAVIKVVEKNEVKFTPKKYKKQILQWLEIMHDWPISRQIVWGIPMPVWYKVERDKDNIWVSWTDKKGQSHQGNASKFLQKGQSLADIEAGLQSVTAKTGKEAPEYVVSEDKPGKDFLPETDTFDTWFSSGQWPLVVLEDKEFEMRFPTDFMGTLQDILRFWISRMIMFSLYRRGQIPFKDVYLWSMVADRKGIKMGKSKGNVINPIDLIDKYGADAFRASLIFGIAQGGTVILSEDKVRAMRNFANKVWNIGRYVYLNSKSQFPNSKQIPNYKSKVDPKQIVLEMQKEYKKLEIKYHKNMEAFHFSRAFDSLYEFIWHRFADVYIESLKQELRSGNIDLQEALISIYKKLLVLLHPFMPYVTEAVWQQFHGKQISILNSKN